MVFDGPKVTLTRVRTLQSSSSSSGTAMEARVQHARSGIIFLWAPFFLHFIHSPAFAASALNMIAPYPAIFVFGDSLSDTGNGVLSGNSRALRTSQLPYGKTFPGWPALRYSDGHVLVDLLATHMGLPFLNPSLNSSGDFAGGVNYAVGGATANNVSFLYSLGIYPSTNISLDVQLSWHLDLQAKAVSSNGRLPGDPADTVFSEGLYIIEIGGNDYMNAYIANYTPAFVISTLIPSVIRRIRNAVETLLQTGAKHFLFVTITPLGCSPAMLAWADGVKDANGCLEEHNLASYLHGESVKEEVASLRVSYPNASFLFLDYYGAYDYVLNHKEMFGFLESLEVCCGAGADYLHNYNPDEECNVESVSVCADPSKYMVWDGVHFTDSLNLQIFNQTFITGTYLDDIPYAFL